MRLIVKFELVVRDRLGDLMAQRGAFERAVFHAGCERNERRVAPFFRRRQRRVGVREDALEPSRRRPGVAMPMQALRAMRRLAAPSPCANDEVEGDPRRPRLQADVGRCISEEHREGVI